MIAGLVLLVASIAACLATGRFVSAIFIVLVSLAALNGWWIGATRIAGVFSGLFAAALLCIPLGKGFEGVFAALFRSAGLINRMISIAAVAVVISVVVAIAVTFVLRRALRKRLSWKRYDRTAGACLGGLEGVLVGLLLFWAILSLEPVATTSLGPTHEGTPDAPNPIAQSVVAAAQEVRRSAVGRIADAINPLHELRLITTFEKGLIVLNDPAVREAFVNHEAMRGVREHPAIRRALEMLAADPQMQVIIESEGSIRGAELATVLRSPAILAVLDDADLRRDLASLADEMERAMTEALETPSAPEEVGEIYGDVDTAVAEFTLMLTDHDARRRTRAANSLGGMGRRAAGAVAALIEALGDRDPRVRSAAARALGDIGPSARDAGAELRRSLEDSDASVRDAAASTLDRIFPPAPAP